MYFNVLDLPLPVTKKELPNTRKKRNGILRWIFNYLWLLSNSWFSSVRPWTTQQTEYLKIRCAAHISGNKPLKKDEAENIIKEMPVLLRHRNWRDVKNKVSLKWWLGKDKMQSSFVYLRTAKLLGQM